MDKDALVLVAGGGGFIGGHLVGRLLKEGFRHVRAVDIKPFQEWHQIFPAAENRRLDLRRLDDCIDAARQARYIYNLACNMGGMGFIENHKAECMLSVLINTHLLLAARDGECERFLLASSACIYAADKQQTTALRPLRESDAYPAMPEDGYGWEKLFSERMCRHFYEDFGLQVRIVRYHNVYGPYGTYDGGREKAPAAICRKVISAIMTGNHEIEIWGDGEQTRSFMYIEDCLRGTIELMATSHTEPINLGSSQLVSINRLVEIAEDIAGIKLSRRYKLDAPVGVRGRNSDNTLFRRVFGWEPSISLEDGLASTYQWIHGQMHKSDETG